MGAALHSAPPGMIQQGSVLMVYGLSMDNINCTKLFNLFCLYGNVVRVGVVVSASLECGQINVKVLPICRYILINFLLKYMQYFIAHKVCNIRILALFYAVAFTYCSPIRWKLLMIGLVMCHTLKLCWIKCLLPCKYSSSICELYMDCVVCSW